MFLGAQKGYPPWARSPPQIKRHTPQLVNPTWPRKWLSCFCTWPATYRLPHVSSSTSQACACAFGWWLLCWCCLCWAIVFSYLPFPVNPAHPNQRRKGYAPAMPHETEDAKHGDQGEGLDAPCGMLLWLMLPACSSCTSSGLLGLSPAGPKPHFCTSCLCGHGGHQAWASSLSWLFHHHPHLHHHAPSHEPSHLRCSSRHPSDVHAWTRPAQALP